MHYSTVFCFPTLFRFFVFSPSPGMLLLCTLSGKRHHDTFKCVHNCLHGNAMCALFLVLVVFLYVFFMGNVNSEEWCMQSIMMVRAQTGILCDSYLSDYTSLPRTSNGGCGGPTIENGVTPEDWCISLYSASAASRFCFSERDDDGSATIVLNCFRLSAACT